MQSRCARVLFSAGIGANLATILAALDRHQTARPRQGPRAPTERGLNGGCRAQPCGAGVTPAARQRSAALILGAGLSPAYSTVTDFARLRG
jgi:hypothetical protein